VLEEQIAMAMIFDAAKFIQSIEGMGASLSASFVQPDGTAEIFRKYKPGANTKAIEDVWNKEIASSTERRDAVAKALLERDR
jgi:hypothetical protein